MSSLPPGSAIDLGAGEGRNSLWLARSGWDVVAMDASVVALKRLRDSAEGEGLAVNGIVADLVPCLDAARERGESFDLVVLAFVHPGPEERSALLSAASSAVARGGYLFVVGHHLASLGHSGPPDRERLYTEDELSHAVPELEVLRLERRSGMSDVTDPGVDVVLWARRPT
ncbi:MAG: methyltransferase domain-containing protein [Acidimicrobiales bacterium]